MASHKPLQLTEKTEDSNRHGKHQCRQTPSTSLLSQAGIAHYSQLLTLQHSTKLLFVLSFFEVDLSLSSKFRPPHA